MSDKANNPLISGDESAISVHTLNNTTTNNTDNTRNIVNQNTNHVVHNNSTVVYQGTAATEKLAASAREEYRRFCQITITSAVISHQIRLTLNERAEELGLTVREREQIEHNVRNRLGSNTLSDIDLRNLSLAINAIAANNAREMLPKLRAMADKSEDDSVQYYASLALAIYEPQQCIIRYENMPFDSYWLTFWTYMAYKSRGETLKAEAALSHLSEWHGGAMMQGQALILNAAGYLYDYFCNNGSQAMLISAHSILTERLSYSPMLKPFADTLRILLKTERPLYFKGNPAIDFYLNLFGAKQKPKPAPPHRPVHIDAHKQDKFFPASANNQTISPILSYLPKLPTSFKWLLPVIPVVGIMVYFIKSCGTTGLETTPIIEEQTIAKPLFTNTSEDKVTTIYRYLASCGYTSSEKALRKELKKAAKKEEVYATLRDSGFTDIGATFDEFNNLVFGINPNTTVPSHTKAGTPSKTVTSNSYTPSNTASSSQAKHDVRVSEINSHPASAPIPAMSKADRLRNEAESGNAKAAYELGEMYLYGNGGVAKSNTQAFNYFYRSAQGGNVSGMYWCGWCYRMGRGTSKNIPQARVWWEKAAAAGNSKAAQGLKELESLM